MIAARALAIILIAAASLQNGAPFWSTFTGDAVGGGKLLLILLDLDGDGRKEIFLAPTSTCGNGGCVWVVYSPTAAANQVRDLGEVAFSDGRFGVAPGSHAITFCWHMSSQYCELGEVRIEHGAIAQRDLGRCQTKDPVCDAKLARIEQWGRAEPSLEMWADIPASGELGNFVWHRGSVVVPASELPDFDHLVVVPPLQ